MSKGDRVKTAGELLREAMEQLKVEKRDLQTSADNWKQVVNQLRELLADKEQQVSRDARSRQMETVTLLRIARAALEQSKLRSASREEELLRRVTQAEESRRRELQEKEDARRRELSEMEDRFEKQLAEKEEQLHKQLLQQDELMKLLKQVCQIRAASAESWAEKQKEVGEMIRENTNIWKQKEAEYKQEVQHLREAILQLQGGPGVEPKHLEPDVSSPEAKAGRLLEVKVLEDREGKAAGSSSEPAHRLLI